MKKITLLFFLMFSIAQMNAQSVVIGTGTDVTTTTASDPIDGYFNAFRYQVVYTAAELSAALTPYDEITALGWSIAGDYGGGALLGYTIKMGHTSAANSAAHDVSPIIVVKTPFDYDPTVTAAGVFDMITFDTNFVWNGVDNILVEVCSDGQNPFLTPYGEVRTTTVANGSRRYRTDGGTACEVNTNNVNGNKPNIQFNYIDGTPPTDELDYYNLQFPATGMINAGGAFDVYAQAYEAGLTDVTSGQAPGISAWIGYSTADTDPSGAGWTWVTAAFYAEVGNNDEYTLDLGGAITSTGTFYYASRWSLNGAPFSYGGIQADGSYGGVWGEDNNISGVLTVDAPLNDLCSGATPLTPGVVFADNALAGQSQVGAIDSGELPLPSCSTYDPVDPTGFGGDIWYSVVVPTDGNITIETQGDPVGNGGDSAISVYSGACGTLAEVECDDDDSDDGFYSLVSIADPLLAGQTLYIRVFEYQGNDLLNFQISAYSATLSVDEFENANTFTYFPNPVKNELSLRAQSNIQNVSIYNMLGQEVLRTAPNNLSSEINMNQLESGTYFVKVTINNTTETVRVIKQ